VPIITLAGKTYAGRMCASTLHQATLADCVAETPDAYVQRAVELASDHAALAEMRRTMRGRLRSSPMLDAKRFATSLESAYRRMWQRWCDTHGNQPRAAG
jgi:predicted O-linked N-acetylglucosamine transferase (SPINDLY family)